MSIVEKALQQGQQASRLVLPPDNMIPASPGLALSVQPSASPASSGATSADLSLTARDLKPIVEVRFDRLRAEGRLAILDCAEQTNEEMRRIKWPLLEAISGRGDMPAVRNNVILVTSAVPSEGKSFVSLNLALSIVRDREMRVILVDGDVARPGLAPAFGLVDRPGLTDVLDDASLDINSVTYRTSVEGLFFVPAGKWYEQSPEFFAGSRMPQVIAALCQRVGRGVIVLDSPPLLATNDAQAATRCVGQVLLVVRAEHTEQRTVLDAIDLVDKTTPLRAILNRVEPTVVSKYYGQYYYGHGNTYRAGSQQVRSEGGGDG